MSAEKRALWDLLFTDYAQFQDFRQFKADTGSNGADYRHIVSGQSLW